MSNPLFSEVILLPFTPEVSHGMEAICDMEFGAEQSAFEIQMEIDEVAQSILLLDPSLANRLLNTEANQEA